MTDKRRLNCKQIVSPGGSLDSGVPMQLPKSSAWIEKFEIQIEFCSFPSIKFPTGFTANDFLVF